MDPVDTNRFELFCQSIVKPFHQIHITITAQTHCIGRTDEIRNRKVAGRSLKIRNCMQRQTVAFPSAFFVNIEQFGILPAGNHRCKNRYIQCFFAPFQRQFQLFLIRVARLNIFVHRIQPVTGIGFAGSVLRNAQTAQTVFVDKLQQ